MSRVLAVVTNHGHFGTKDQQTGLWFNELVHFLDVMARAGHPVDVVSAIGGRVPLDPRSLVFPFMDDTARSYYENPAFMHQLEHSRAAAEAGGVDYDVVYFAGGHGTLWDFPDNEALQRLTRDIYQRGGIVSGVCHGPAALVNVRLADGNYLISGRKVTGYTNTEEALIGDKDDVPFLLENALKSRGAEFESALVPMTKKVVDDGNLITGQNPASAKGVGEAVAETLVKLAVGAD